MKKKQTTTNMGDIVVDQDEKSTNAKRVSFTTARDNNPVQGSSAAEEEGEGEDHAQQQQQQQGGDQHRAVGNAGSRSNHHDGSHHHARRSLSDQMPWYTPPIQRQRWGEEQLAPHTEWGDIFFDLFYVAAAYNLGNLLREDPTQRGLLYLCGCFLPLMNLWTFKMYFDARYLIPGGNDVFHQCFDMISLLALATAALHIRPVAIMSNPAHGNNYDTFAFCASVGMASLLHLGRLLEVAVCQGVFHTYGLFLEAFCSVRHEAIYEVPTVLCYMAAVIYSGLHYFGQHDDDASSYENEGNASLSAPSSTVNYRSLASDETPLSYTSNQDSPIVPDDVAIWLLLVGFLIGIFMMVLDVLYVKKGDHKMTTVPMNIGYAIHRYGELVMLLLGESVLSLLIVDLNEGYDYYLTFFAGVITVILLQYLHFQSHSHDPDKHAMRRSVFSGIGYYILMFAYAPALIILGTCYKMFMFEFENEEESNNYDPEESSSSHGRRMLFQALLFAPQQRSLAGGTSAALRFSTQERQQRIADFFSGSLAVVWLCLDLMILAHRGLQDNLARSRESGSLCFGACAMVFFRAGLILFAATLSQYMSDPTTLSFLGMVGIIGQLLLRAVGTVFLPPDKQDQEEQESEALEMMAGYIAARLRDTRQADRVS